MTAGKQQSAKSVEYFSSSSYLTRNKLTVRLIVEYMSMVVRMVSKSWRDCCRR